MSTPRWRASCTSLAWTSAVALSLVTGVVSAQTETDLPSLPGAAVLVVKLVSAERVSPVTGIVVSDTGKIVVPAGFAGPGDEIFVLDGGTDIVTNGRPARFEKTGPGGRLSLLSVAGMDRPGIRLSTAEAPAASDLFLAAYPPARELARGAPPLIVKLPVSGKTSGQDLTTTSAPSLPNVSGPIIDACGHLAGIRLASGPQSLKPGPATIVTGAELTTLLDALAPGIPAADCVLSARTPVDEPTRADAVPSQEETSSNGLESPVEVGAETPGPGAVEPGAVESETGPVDTDPAPPVGDEIAVQTPPATQTLPAWLLMLSGAVLAAAAWAVVRLARNRLRAGKAQTAMEGTGGGNDGPRFAPGNEQPMPDLAALPPGCNALIEITATGPDGFRCRRYRPVDLHDVDLVIGRREADLDLGHGSVGERHARLHGHEGALKLTDLGSGLGTAVRGVPCVAGDTFYVDRRDEFWLGDLTAMARLVTRERGAS